MAEILKVVLPKLLTLNSVKRVGILIDIIISINLILENKGVGNKLVEQIWQYGKSLFISL